MNKLLLLFIFVPILGIILLGLNILLAPHIPDEAKVSAYECGFETIHGQTRSTFHIHFYLVAMLFLIFDLEILLTFPVALTMYQVSLFGFIIFLIFFFVLTIGFAVEISSGAISIIKRKDDINTPNIPNNKDSCITLYKSKPIVIYSNYKLNRKIILSERQNIVDPYSNYFTYRTTVVIFLILLLFSLILPATIGKIFDIKFENIKSYENLFFYLIYLINFGLFSLSFYFLFSTIVEKIFNKIFISAIFLNSTFFLLNSDVEGDDLPIDNNSDWTNLCDNPLNYFPEEVKYLNPGIRQILLENHDEFKNNFNNYLNYSYEYMCKDNDLTESKKLAPENIELGKVKFNNDILVNEVRISKEELAHKLFINYYNETGLNIYKYIYKNLGFNSKEAFKSNLLWDNDNPDNLEKLNSLRSMPYKEKDFAIDWLRLGYNPYSNQNIGNRSSSLDFYDLDNLIIKSKPKTEFKIKPCTNLINNYNNNAISNENVIITPLKVESNSRPSNNSVLSENLQKIYSNKFKEIKLRDSFDRELTPNSLNGKADMTQVQVTTRYVESVPSTSKSIPITIRKK